MRNIVIGVCSLALFLMLLMVGYTVTAREKRSAELEAALDLAMEQTVENLGYPDEYCPQNDEELVALFEQQFLAQLSSEAEYQIKILDVDCKKGLLSVEVTERYAHLNGKPGSITIQKMIIRDKTAETAVYGTKSVSFFLNDRLYRRYEQNAGSFVAIPRDPCIENAAFSGWRCVEDGVLYTKDMLETMVVEENMEFLAELN